MTPEQIALTPVEPTGTRKAGAIVCSRKHGCQSVQFDFPTYPVTDRARSFQALRLELWLGPVRAAGAVGIDPNELLQLEAGALVPREPDGWERAEERLRVRAIVDAIAMLRPHPAPRCPLGKGPLTSVCQLDAGHEGECQPLPPTRWPLCRWPMSVLAEELRAAGFTTRLEAEGQRDFILSGRSGVSGFPSAIGLTPQARLWGQLFIPRQRRTPAG